MNPILRFGLTVFAVMAGYAIGKQAALGVNKVFRLHVPVGGV